MSKHRALTFVLVWALLFVGLTGLHYGWLTELIRVPSGFFDVFIQLKIISLFGIVLLALVIAVLCSFFRGGHRWTSGHRLPLVLVALIPEMLALYELAWNFGYWISRGFTDTTFSVLHTKLAMVFLFCCLAFQISVLMSKRKG